MLIDHRPDDWEYLNFVLFDMESNSPGVYFVNTSPSSVHNHHRDFMEAHRDRVGPGDPRCDRL